MLYEIGLYRLTWCKTIIPYYASVMGHFSLAGGILYEETHVLEMYRTSNITQVEVLTGG